MVYSYIYLSVNIWNTCLLWHSCFWFWKYGLCSGAGNGWERCWGVPKLQNLSTPYVGLCLSWQPEGWVILTSILVFCSWFVTCLVEASWSDKEATISPLGRLFEAIESLETSKNMPVLVLMVTWLDEGIFSFFGRGNTWNFAKQLCLEVFGVVETKLHSLFWFSPPSNLFSDMFINWPWNFLHTLVKHLFGSRIHKIHKQSSILRILSRTFALPSACVPLLAEPLSGSFFAPYATMMLAPWSLDSIRMIQWGWWCKRVSPSDLWNVEMTCVGEKLIWATRGRMLYIRVWGSKERYVCCTCIPCKCILYIIYLIFQEIWFNPSKTWTALFRESLQTYFNEKRN